MTEQPICKKCKGTGIIFRRFIPSSIGESQTRPCPDCKPEQPNTELLIVKTIQGLMSAASRELTVLNKMVSIAKHKVLIDEVLEDIASTERATLFELQKAFE